MNTLPTELIFLLLIAGAVVFNFLKQRAARRQKIAKRLQAAAAQAESTELTELERQAIGDEIWQPPPVAVPPSAAERLDWRRDAAASASPARGGRRFSRQALLGTRRQVQEAFVLATILGRCRGDEPHDMR